MRVAIIHVLVLIFTANQVSCSWLPAHLPALRQVGEETSEKCERISGAMDDLWDAIPDVDLATRPDEIALYGGSKFKTVVENEFTNRAALSGFVTPSNTISTHQGRHEVACKLAGVKNVDDFEALFHERFSAMARRQYQDIQQFFRERKGMAKLRDLKELINMIFYFTRITGFPNFPLDIYDEDMARYFVQRVQQHELALEFIFSHAPRDPLTEENVNSFVQAITSETPEMFWDLTGTRSSSEDSMSEVNRILAIYSVTPEFVNLVEVLYDVGFFGL